MGVVALRKRKAVRDFQKFKAVSEGPSRSSEETSSLEPEVLEDSALLGGGSEPVSFYFESYGDNGMERELQTGMEVLTETGEGGTVTGKVEKFVPWADEVFLR
jgi:hypothetical protein